MDCFQNEATPWTTTGQWGSRGTLFEQPLSETAILAPSSSVSESDCTFSPTLFSDAVRDAVRQWLSGNHSKIVFNGAASDKVLEELAHTGGLLHDTDGSFAEHGDSSAAVFRDMLRIQNHPPTLYKSLAFLRKYFGNATTPPPAKVTRPAMLRALAHESTDAYFDGFESDFVVHVIWSCEGRNRHKRKGKTMDAFGYRERALGYH